MHQFTGEADTIKDNMLRLKQERDDMFDKINSIETDMKQLELENENLMQQVEEAEKEAENHINAKFHRFSDGPAQDSEEEVKEETEEEKAKRERFERLMEISHGISIR